MGVTRSQLRGAGYRRLGAGLYRWAGLEEGPQLTLAAVARRLPTGAAFSGLSAAWLHGLDVEPCNPIEVTIPEPSGSSRRAGASVRRSALAADEIVLRRGVPTTSALRTVVDLGGRNPLTEGVVAADAFLHAGLVSLAELRTYLVKHPRARGIARLGRVVDLAEPNAESPMETRLRMLLILAGLPRPEVQISIDDDDGRFLGRPDLLYRRQRWPSNTTAITIVIGWFMTTAAKMAWSTPVFACSALPPRMSTRLPITLRCRCATASARIPGAPGS